jgi:transposase
MSMILPRLRFFVKQGLLRQLRKCKSAGLRLRYLMIINIDNGRSARQTAAILGVHNTTVYRVVQRYREHGEWGLFDSREDNGTTKLEEHYLDALYRVVRSSPQCHGWRRPTWTREMLVETLARRTGVHVHVATLSRALALIKARRGRPRPSVRCPWSPAARLRRIHAIQGMLASLPRRHVAVYEDEVDIHLNPKIGLDWMVCGQQKEVVTPGQNEKRYLAGALDARTGRVAWVEGERKTSALFLRLLQELLILYSQARVIHVVLDNYRIHDSKIVQAALRGWKGRIHFHFLPPYCPNDNRIERLWEDLHANVTRNHTCATMDALLAEVHDYLRHYNRLCISSTTRKAG